MAENKVQFNLKNVHYAILTPDAQGVPSWGTPVAVPGAVTLTLDENGNMDPFYADGIVYYMGSVNNGYSGSLEMARFPDQMMMEVWGMTQDATSKVIHESANTEAKEFALQYQIDGDQNNTLFTLYRCRATRPGIGSTTNTDSKTPQTQSVKITTAPVVGGTLDGRILSRTTAETPEATKTGWFSAIPTA